MHYGNCQGAFGLADDRMGHLNILTLRFSGNVASTRLCGEKQCVAHEIAVLCYWQNIIRQAGDATETKYVRACTETCLIRQVSLPCS